MLRNAGRALRLQPGQRVLDYGCGDGYFTEQLSRRSGAGAVGYDIVSYPEWLQRDPAVRFDRGIVPTPYEDASFDAIFCSQVFEHVPEPELVAREFARLLKPGGRLWLATPNSYKNTWPLFHSLQRHIDLVEGHYRHFDRDEIAAHFEPLGFRITSVRYDLFLGLFLYYRFVVYNPRLKRALLRRLVPEIAMPGFAPAPSRIRAVAKRAAFGVLSTLRRFDELFSAFPSCQTIEVTLLKERAR